MNKNNEEPVYIMGFSLLFITAIIFIIVAFMQSKIEKLDTKVKELQVTVDSIVLITNYNDNHSEIK